ncbi:MAG: 4-hydroxy-3-methylbut-2-enyl diphosphate reductase, partial [Bacteroidales bacterium]|nr:4-hydroxy-3-methylbut-2-enyl diphosphate reductase [Bacteroidales bacterium]
MQVTIDEQSGFCFGVVSAIKAAEAQLSRQPGGLYCLGHIVHNSQEVERLAALGLKVIGDEVFRNLHKVKVLIRAHGEPPETYRIAEKNHIELIDATCPMVLKLQERIKQGFDEVSAQNGQVLIYGKAGHAEVRGLNGQTGNRAIVISRFEDAVPLRYDRPTRLYSQTTMNEADYLRLAGYIRQRCEAEGGAFEMVNSICKSMSARADKLKAFALAHDALVFVSDKKSSNGQYLYEICKTHNPHTFFITGPHDLDREAFRAQGFQSVGVCGATSTP